MKTINLNLNKKLFSMVLFAAIIFIYSNTANAQSPAKEKIKIVVEDEKGNKKEYSSLEEMPADLRAEFLKGNRPFIFRADTSYFKSLKELTGKSMLDANNLMFKKFLNSDSIYMKKMLSDLRLT